MTMKDFVVLLVISLALLCGAIITIIIGAPLAPYVLWQLYRDKTRW